MGIMEKVVIFGAGGTGHKLADELEKKYEVLCFIDNDKERQGSKIGELEVCSIERIIDLDYDKVF